MNQEKKQIMEDGTHDLVGVDLTQEVLATFDNSKSERFQQIMQSLVKHMHAFLKDVELTEEEWFKGIDYLTNVGHITDDKRQEFVLLSDVLGVSMQVIDINHNKHVGATASTVFGPFFLHDLPGFVNGDDIANGASGEPCFMYGQILSTTGEPLPDAHIEVWQADDEGFYDIQHKESAQVYGRGHLSSDKDGRYFFWSVKPEAYPVPGDGPVGELLDTANRSSMRPAHVHFMITVPGYNRLITHVFKEGDPYLSSDAVFGVKKSLVTSFEHHQAGEAPDGKQMDVPFYTMHYDFLLAPTETKEEHVDDSQS